jgi:hypothetical protein
MVRVENATPAPLTDGSAPHIQVSPKAAMTMLHPMRAPISQPRHSALQRRTLLLAALVTRPAAAATWWGQTLSDQPKNFIFGYGSLLNAASRAMTEGRPVPAIPARVSAELGFLRNWSDRSPSGFTALGLRRPHPGEAAQTINGVLYAVEGTDMARFDAREQGYARLPVPRDMIQPVSWQALPPTGEIWIYVPMRPGHAPGEALPLADPEFPLLQSYIDVVVEGALDYGEAYAREVLETTADWSRYWLNDRELARRPWVHDPRAGAIDALLGATAPAAALLVWRMFPERYAIRWSSERGR